MLPESDVRVFARRHRPHASRTPRDSSRRPALLRSIPLAWCGAMRHVPCVDLRSQNRLYELPVRGSRKYDSERLPSSRACIRRLHDACSCLHREIELSSRFRRDTVSTALRPRAVSATVGFLRTRFGTFPPGPRCARSTSATRNHQRPGPVLSALDLPCRPTFVDRWRPRIPAFHDARDRSGGTVSARPRCSPGFALTIFTGDIPSPRRLQTRPSQGRSRIPSGSRSLPRRLREEAAIRTTQDAFPRLAPSFPTSRREPHPGVGVRPRGRSFVPAGRRAEGAVARSPLEQPVRACASGLASRSRRASSLRDGALRGPELRLRDRILQHETRRTGHRRRALASSPARGRRP